MAQTHAQDLATQDRLTRNIKDILWLNTFDAGKNVSASDALAALLVRDPHLQFAKHTYSCFRVWNRRGGGWMGGLVSRIVACATIAMIML